MPKRLLITGVSGFFGRALLPLLQEDPRVGRIIGVDIRPPAGSEAIKKLEFHSLDVRQADLAPLMDGVDAALHMAFVLMRTPRTVELDATNIHGAKRVLKAAAQAGVPKVIFTSSVVGYGLHADNPIPLTESMPLRPNPGLYYSRQKAAVEAYIDGLEKEYPQTHFVRLRPCTVVGGAADRAQMASLLAKTGMAVRGYNPPYQLVHQDDLATALQLAIHEGLQGAYNVVSDDPLTMPELLAARGGRVVALPLAVMKILFSILWRTGAIVFAPEWIDLSRFSLVASNSKLKAAGWRPSRTTLQAYLALQDAFGDG